MPTDRRLVPALLMLLGAVVAVLGLAALLAALLGDGGVVLLVLGALAVLVGGYVALVGLGARRRLAALDAAAAERALDQRIADTVAAADCAHEPSACGSCGAACALSGSRYP